MAYAPDITVQHAGKLHVAFLAGQFGNEINHTTQITSPKKVDLPAGPYRMDYGQRGAVGGTVTRFSRS